VYTKIKMLGTWVVIFATIFAPVVYTYYDDSDDSDDSDSDDEVFYDEVFYDDVFYDDVFYDDEVF
jgi:hypothetical protein